MGRQKESENGVKKYKSIKSTFSNFYQNVKSFAETSLLNCNLKVFEKYLKLYLELEFIF